MLLCNVKSIPDGIPTDPNPRDQNTDRAIYKEIKESLLNSGDLTFHLKNKGITIIASDVSYDESKKAYTVLFNKGDGIVDGGHTYRILLENMLDAPDDQYVKIEILTGIEDDMLVDIARGLNTAVQVTRMSLANLDEKFEWIKKILKGEIYEKEISYKENEEGEFTIREIIGLLTLFNIDLFPDGKEHPKVAYISKEECLKRYIASQKSYEKIEPILKDILELYDYIQLKSHTLYNNKYNGKGRKLAFYQDRKRGKYKFIFTGQESKFRLFDGALYPILGAFRAVVEQDERTGKYRWRLRSFAKIKKLFDEVGADLINVTRNTSDNRGKNPNAIGKDESNWDNLYKTVYLAYLERIVNQGR